MQPIRLTLLAMLALAAFIPAVSVLAPITFLNAAFLLAAPLPLLVGVQAWASRRPHGLAVNAPAAFWLGIAFLAIQAVALLRGLNFSASPDIRESCYRMLLYGSMIVMSLWAAHVISRRTSLKIDTFATAVYLLALYCAANLVLWAMGVTSPIFQISTEERGVLAGLFGLDVNRVLFPMGWGVNNFSMVSGVALAAGIVKYSKQKRPLDLALLVIAPFLCCLLADSRAALFGGILAGVMAGRFPRMSTKALVAFWVLGSAVVFFSEAGPLFSFGQREASASGTFTGREVIWAAGLLEFTSFQWEHVFGYGQFGQFESGAYQLYEMLFQGYSDRPELISLHNAYLQVAMDSGYVGLAVLVAFIVAATRALSRHRDVAWTYQAALAALIFLAMDGLTEVSLSLYQPWILLTLAAMLPLFRRKAAP